jgi:pectate lyase
MRPIQSRFWLSSWGLLLTSVAPALAAPLAFPGAEGFGAGTPGGRGGQVLLVTNLQDYRPGSKSPIPGSLRAACEAKGPRIVVFRVSGTIPLDGPLAIREPFITIAGQSAPGDGICLKNYGMSIGAHDVIVRHLRVRPGDELGPMFRQQGKSFEPDGISVSTPSQNVIIDHCSVSWAIDECLSVSGAGITEVTAQWCIVSEALHDSFHAKGPHGYGSLLRANGNLSFHHNLYAHNSSRSPRPGTYGAGSVLLDFRNNVIHDTMGYSAADPVRMNYVGNYIQRPRKYIFQVGGKTTQIFAAGNLLADGGARNNDQWELITNEADENKVAQPYPVAPVKTQTAQQALEAVIAGVGATLPHRDAVDARVIGQLKDGKGGLINSQKEVGGWPELKQSAAPADADQDGMPDAWETQHGLDSQNAQDAALDRDGDGYTNIEEYLNGTNPAVRDPAE